MTFVTPDELHECALDGSYLEIWKRLPGSQGRSESLWLSGAGADTRAACLLRAGEFFLFAASRPEPLHAGKPLSTQIAGASPAEAERMLALELSFGRIDASGHSWRIELSTLPSRSGKTLLLDPAPHLALSEWPAQRLAGLGAYPPAFGWKCAEPPVTRCQNEEAIA